MTALRSQLRASLIARREAIDLWGELSDRASEIKAAANSISLTGHPTDQMLTDAEASATRVLRAIAEYRGRKR